jgi:hypothetical protein
MISENGDEGRGELLIGGERVCLLHSEVVCGIELFHF